MLTLRKASERGHANHGWLDSYHTFSFAGYQDPNHMGFRQLRVINQDRVAGGGGFATHSHRDMEIVSYVLEGALEHKDSMGNGATMVPGDVQRMSAGTGVSHSEYNHSQTDLVHFLQIWIYPDRNGVEPSYEQKMFPPEHKQDQLRLIVARDGVDGAVHINQDVKIYAAILNPGTSVTHQLPAQRYGWVQVAKGQVKVNELTLEAGDGLAISDLQDLSFVGGEEAAEFLLFDLP
ncbi:MAG: pirin family protein [Pseudanabaenaceae cyanobacterium bins.68]|nr:pirin family protein [Pseudanabaenaceae cyanobacterium bins.68]